MEVVFRFWRFAQKECSISLVLPRCRFLEPPVLRPPPLVAKVRRQTLQSRAGYDRHAVGMVQPNAGIEHVLRPKADDEPPRGREIGPLRIVWERFRPAIERGSI